MTGEVHVIGLPRPQGSKTAFTVKRKGAIGNTASDYTSVVTDAKVSGLKEWRLTIGMEVAAWCKTHRQAPLDGAVLVEMIFELPRPASARKDDLYPTRHPDLDKLVRAACDAMTKIAWTDDARVVKMNLEKKYARDAAPGVRILWRQIYPLTQADFLDDERALNG